MTMKDGEPTSARGRGRPRKYQAEQVLDQAMNVFHQKGYAATSLDDLASAMAMSRPSLYNAFGNKQSIYRHAFENFRNIMRKETQAVLTEDADLATALAAFYNAALDVYFRAHPAAGCFVFCTAPVEALTHADIRDDVRSVMEEVDAELSKKFVAAQAAGQFPKRFPADEAARVAQAILHSLALRARTGEPRASLNGMVKNAVTLLCARDV